RAQKVGSMSRKSKERERVARRDWAKRLAVEVWYPKASDLPLVSLPEEVREHVRRRIAPWLRKMVYASDFDGRRGQRLGVEGGECWQVAQSLVIAAGDDAGVKYIE